MDNSFFSPWENAIWDNNPTASEHQIEIYLNNPPAYPYEIIENNDWPSQEFWNKQLDPSYHWIIKRERK